MNDYPEMVPALSEFFLSILPPEGNWKESEMEGKFKAYNREVKKLYPEYCKNAESWVKTSHKLLFHDYTKTLTENPRWQTPSLLKSWGWLFDRFSLALDKIEGESKDRLSA